MYSRCIIKDCLGKKSDCPLLGMVLGTNYCMSESFNCAFKTSDKMSISLDNFTICGDLIGFKRADIINDFLNGKKYSEIFSKLCKETPYNHQFISKYLEVIVKQLAINKRRANELWKNRKV